jgi:zinc transporter
MTLSPAAAGGDTADATPQSGIVWIYHFQPDGTAALVPNAAVERALADHVGWTWVHLSLADVRCRAWIAQHAPLSELAREILLGPDEHLRLDVLGHEIVGVVPDLHQDIAQATDALVRLRFVMTERMLISARRTPAHSVEINRRAIESGKRFPSAV